MKDIEIKTYEVREGYTEWLVPEYRTLYKKYPKKDKMISEILENMYYARTRVKKHNVYNILEKIWSMICKEKFKIEEFGMSIEEFNLINDLNSQFMFENYTNMRNALLSRGLLIISHSNLDYYLNLIEYEIEFYE